MTFDELLKHNKSEIRESSFLTFLFISAYFQVFGFKPSCSGCSINNELGRLAREVKNKGMMSLEIVKLEEKEIMKNTNKTFVLSPLFSDVMLAYVDANKVVRRKFTSKLTDDFVIEYLTNGTEEEIEERKKNFTKLPKGYSAKEEKDVKEEEKVVKKRTRKAK